MEVLLCPFETERSVCVYLDGHVSDHALALRTDPMVDRARLRVRRPGVVRGDAPAVDGVHLGTEVDLP